MKGVDDILMAMEIEPVGDYLLIQLLDSGSGVVSEQQMADTRQYGKIVKAGKGDYYGERWHDTEHEPGQKVYWIKHSETDTPASIRQLGLVLVKDTRIMAIESTE
jgi:co-chaperonin GroES (HSP10)